MEWDFVEEDLVVEEMVVAGMVGVGRVEGGKAEGGKEDTTTIIFAPHLGWVCPHTIPAAPGAAQQSEWCAHPSLPLRRRRSRMAGNPTTVCSPVPAASRNGWPNKKKGWAWDSPCGTCAHPLELARVDPC